MKTGCVPAGLAAACLASAAYGQGELRITEWMYNGDLGEFVEFTNVGDAPIDMSGWSYDDDSQTPGIFSLSGFGMIQPGVSVIITESPAELFRSAWGLSASVPVLGEYTNNLGRADQINLFDASGGLVDRLTYGDQVFPGTIRTDKVSGNPLTPAALGADDPFQWVLAFAGDQFGSYVAADGVSLGNPGIYVPGPGPGAAALCLAGMFAGRRRR